MLTELTLSLVMSPGAAEQMHTLNLTLFVDIVVQKTDKEDLSQARESVTLAGREPEENSYKGELNTVSI